VKNIVLLCCPQKSYFSSEGPMYYGEKSDILKIRIENYLKSLNKNDTIVYAIREIHENNDKFYSSVRTHSVVGSKDIEIPEIFKSYISLIINTNRYNAFYKTPLDSELYKIKPHKIYIIGVETHNYVLFNAEECRNRGYDVTIIEPLVLSSDEYMHLAGISIMKNYLSVNIEQ